MKRQPSAPSRSGVTSYTRYGKPGSATPSKDYKPISAKRFVPPQHRQEGGKIGFLGPPTVPCHLGPNQHLDTRTRTTHTIGESFQFHRLGEGQRVQHGGRMPELWRLPCQTSTNTNTKSAGTPNAALSSKHHIGSTPLPRPNEGPKRALAA